ncbi:putative ethanolamine kinase A [Yarrowia sp. C11]|nr:putative ethanolamine kinase A [Yarrowia sp. E02]KAG5372914.1 putative ethanolamine kinase A [Yarrowia sp. C11]
MFLPDESLEIRSDSDGEEDLSTCSNVPSSATSLEDEGKTPTHHVSEDTVNPRDFVDVRRIIHKIFPQCVSSANDPRVEIAQLKGGITNMLLLVSYPNPSKGNERDHVLVRAYGNGTSTIIDRDRELATHLHLHSHGLAPTLFARLSNALIYEYIPGKAVEYTDLSRPEIMSGVASRLAEWHQKLDKTKIESEMTRLKALDKAGQQSTSSRDIYELLEEWINVLPRETEAQKKRVQDVTAELKWIKQTISDQGGPIVVGHCDLLSGNIIVPEKWTPAELKEQSKSHGKPLTGSQAAFTEGKNIHVKSEKSTDLKKPAADGFAPSTLTSFIDYEYSIPTPRAFDLANHFMEWQGFDCVVELIPEPSVSNPVMRTWAAQYLQSLAYFADQTQPSSVSEAAVDSLITEIATWWGMPGFYWGIWAIIQATISEIDFDYAEYAEKRLSEYYKWKKGRE